MSDQRTPTDRSERDQAPGVDDSPPTGMPRWAKIFLLVAASLIVLFVVLQLTGGGHGPARHLGGSHGVASRVAEGASEIAVVARDLRFDPAEIKVRVGEDVALVLTSLDTLHDLTIDELDAHVGAERGETAKGGFRAEEPGRYTFYCSVPGHRQAGMEGELIVEVATSQGGGGEGHTPPHGGH